MPKNGKKCFSSLPETQAKVDEGDTNSVGATVSRRKNGISTFLGTCLYAIREIPFFLGKLSHLHYCYLSRPLYPGLHSKNMCPRTSYSFLSVPSVVFNPAIPVQSPEPHASLVTWKGDGRRTSADRSKKNGGGYASDRPLYLQGLRRPTAPKGSNA